MSTGADSPWFFYAMVLVLVVPLVLTGIAMRRVKSARPAEPGSGSSTRTRPARPGYAAGIVTGVVAVLISLRVLDRIEPPPWVAAAVFAGLFGVPFLVQWLGPRRSWFAAGIPLGVGAAFVGPLLFALPFMAIAALI